MYSKIILICLIVILAGLILFLGGYLLSNKNPGQEANIGRLNRFSSTEQADSLQSKAHLYRLSTSRVSSPALSEDGKRVLFFDSAYGKVLDSDFIGKDSMVVSGKLLNGFSTAQWSPNSYEAILAQRSRDAFGLSYFNLKTGQTSKLHTNITNPAWSPNGKKIAYLFFDAGTGEGNISISNPDGSVYKSILPTRLDQLTILWPKEDLLAFYNRAGAEQTLFSLPAAGGQLEKIIGPVSNLRTVWSPDGAKLWLSYTLDQERKTVLLNLATRVETPFNFLTSADKCAWGANSVQIYCGGKETEDQSEGLYVVDTKTESVRHLFTPAEIENIDISDPLLTPAEDYFIFVNAYDQYLYSVSL